MDTSTILIKSKLTASLFFSRNPTFRNCIKLINKTPQCRCLISSSLLLYLWSRRKRLLQSDESQSLCLPHVWRRHSSCFPCDAGSSSAACLRRNPAEPHTDLIFPSKSNILFKQIQGSVEEQQEQQPLETGSPRRSERAGCRLSQPAGPGSPGCRGIRRWSRRRLPSGTPPVPA